MPLPRLHRRTVLRGIGAAAVPLPALEVMFDSRGAFAAGGTPLRYLLCFGGFPLCADGDTAPDPFTPKTLGASYELGPALAPLAGFGNVKNVISVLSGIRIPHNDRQFPAPPGGLVGPGDVHYNHNPLLTGQRMTAFQAGAVTG